MAILRPDEYKHQNPDLAFTDSDSVRGGARVVANRAALYALASKADQLKQDVTVVRIKADADNGGASTQVLLVDITKINSTAGWQLVVATPGGPSTPGTGASGFALRRADINEHVVALPTDAPQSISRFGYRPVGAAGTPVAYDRHLSKTTPAATPGESDGVVFDAASTQALDFTAIVGAAGAVLSLDITDSSDGSVSQVNFRSDYAGEPFDFTRADGYVYTGFYPSANQSITA